MLNHMTVEELIAELQKYPPETNVAGFSAGCGCHETDIPSAFGGASITLVLEGKNFTRRENMRQVWHGLTPRQLDLHKRRLESGKYEDGISVGPPTMEHSRKLVRDGGSFHTEWDTVTYNTGPYLLLNPSWEEKFTSED